MEKVTKGLTNWLSSEGMTQKDVAEKLGVSEQFVNALFNDRREFGKKTANDWQNLCGLSASWLRTGEGKMLADDEAVAFAYSLTLTDFELCRNFSNKIKKKLKKEIKKEATPILGEAYCGKLCMCTRFAFSGTFIFVSRTCKSE